MEETSVNQSLGQEKDHDNSAGQPAPSPDSATQAAAEQQSAQMLEHTLEKTLEQTQAKLITLEENVLRAKAETENVRRRANEEVEKAHKFAIERFAEYLVPVIDSLEAALADGSNDPAKVREGVELTLRQLLAALEKGRVVAINPIGEKFDPHRHQAISMVPAEQEPNTIVSVLQKGYLLADRVLRPALVTVAQPK